MLADLFETFQNIIKHSPPQKKSALRYERGKSQTKDSSVTLVRTKKETVCMPWASILPAWKILTLILLNARSAA